MPHTHICVYNMIVYLWVRMAARVSITVALAPALAFPWDIICRGHSIGYQWLAFIYYI